MTSASKLATPRDPPVRGWLPRKTTLNKPRVGDAITQPTNTQVSNHMSKFIASLAASMSKSKGGMSWQTRGGVHG
eukprot:6172768-Pleurochrysis_carterae.AAC.2